MQAIEEYLSYRDFVKDWISFQKTKSSEIGLSYLAKRSKISLSGLKMIVDGQRNLTVHKIHDLAEALSLSQKEHEFFESLVFYEQAKEKHESDYYLRKLKSYQENSLPLKRLEFSDKELLSNWYTLPLSVYLLYVERCTPKDLSPENRERIAQKLNISDKNLEAVLNLLEQSGISHPDNENSNQVFSKIFNAAPRIVHLEKVNRLSLEKLHSGFHQRDHYFGSSVLSIAQEEIESFIEDYKKLIDTYMAKEHGESNVRVVQASCSFFPVL